MFELISYDAMLRFNLRISNILYAIKDACGSFKQCLWLSLWWLHAVELENNVGTMYRSLEYCQWNYSWELKGCGVFSPWTFILMESHSEWGILICVPSLIQAVLWSTSLHASVKLTIVHRWVYKTLQQCARAWWMGNCDSCHGCLFRYSCAYNWSSVSGSKLC